MSQQPHQPVSPSQQPHLLEVELYDHIRRDRRRSRLVASVVIFAAVFLVANSIRGELARVDRSAEVTELRGEIAALEAQLAKTHLELAQSLDVVASTASRAKWMGEKQSEIITHLGEKIRVLHRGELDYIP